MKCDVIIVGAGVSGLLTAVQLAEAGSDCCLLDRGSVGMESSWAGGGILSPLYPWNYPEAVSALAAWSTKNYPAFLSRLREQTGIDPEWINSGHLILDEDITFEAVGKWAETHDISVRPVEQQELQQLEPAIADNFQRALWFAGIGQVRNPRLIHALHARARQLGIRILEGNEARELLISDNGVSGIRTDGDTFTADQVLIATGAWGGIPLNINIRPLPIEPVKGQMIQFQTEPGTIQRISLYKGRYVIPRKDGKVLAGSTLEHTGFDKSTDPSAAGKLRQAAAELFPILASAPVINQWAGLRPGNERQTPYIGEHPEIRGLFFNIGHFRNGIILGLASARLCADLILGQAPVLDPAAYALYS